MYATITAPMEAQQINRDLYVGYGELTTIQKAVDTATTMGTPYGLIHIPADYQGSDQITAVVNGNANLFILDERGAQRQLYVWVNNAYAPGPFVQKAGIGVPQINHTLIVGTSKYATIQSAINDAVSFGGNFGIVISPTYTGSENIGTLTGGSTGIYLSDQRNDGWQNYHWNGTQYVASDLTTGGNIHAATGYFTDVQTTTLEAQTAAFAAAATLQGSPIRTFANSPGPGGTMQWPPAGIAQSTGTAWSPSIDPATVAMLNRATNVFSGEVDATTFVMKGQATGRIQVQNAASNPSTLGGYGVRGISGDGTSSRDYFVCTDIGSGISTINAATAEVTAISMTVTKGVHDTPVNSLTMDVSGNVGRFVYRGPAGNTLGGFQFTGFSADGSSYKNYMVFLDGGVNQPLVQVIGNLNVRFVGANVFTVGQTTADTTNPVQLACSVYTPSTGGYGANGGVQLEAVHQGVQWTDFKINPNGGNVYLGAAGTTTYVNGTLSVTGAKNFQIVHPLDPNKLLTHSVVEGPECAVFYRGEGECVGGMAEITLPDYFEALVHPGGRTVQITPKVDFNGGNFGAIAATDVIGGKFRVYSKEDSQRFFWEVKAVRGDIPPLEVVTDRELTATPAEEMPNVEMKPGEPVRLKKKR